MRRGTIILGAVLLILRTVAAENGPAVETRTWWSCVEEAKKNNPDLLAALEVIGQSRATRSIKASPLFPQVNSEMRDGRVRGTDAVYTNAHSITVTGKQLLFDGFKTPFDIEQADQTLVASRFNYAVTSSQVRLRLRQAFTELLTAQELLNITRNIAQRRKQNNDLVQLRYEAGREHRGSLLLAQADLAQADYDVVEAARAIVLSQRRLSKEMGRTHMLPLAAEGDFEVASRAAVRPDFEAMADGNPFLEKLIAQTGAARFGLDSAKADFFPQVFGDLSAGKLSQDWPPNKNEWSMGLSVSYPLFEGRRRMAEVYRTRAVLNQAAADEKSGRDGVILTLEGTWKRLQDTLDQVGVQQKFLIAGEERAKITRAQYGIGLVLFDDWTIIEDALVRAKKAFLAAEAASLIAEADWIQARGGTLENEPLPKKP